MKVKDLIEKLKDLDPNLEILVDSDNDFESYSDFEIKKENWYNSNFKKTKEEYILIKKIYAKPHPQLSLKNF